MSNQWTPPLRTEWMLNEEKQPYFQQSRWTSRTDKIEGEWGNDHYSNPTRYSLLFVYDQFKLPKENFKKSQEKSHEISETSEATCPAPKSDLSVVNYNSAESQKATMHSQRFLEIKPENDCQPCIWCISYNSQPKRQETIMRTTAGERPLPSFSGSAWNDDSVRRRLGVRELLGDECLDFLMPVETGSPNQVPNNNSIRKRNNGTMQKLQSYSELVDTLKNDREFREFRRHTDEQRLIDQENREYFDKTYGITYIHPLLVDRSGLVFLFLDNRGIMFKWSEMTQDMHVLGINKMEGLANYLYHPDKVCAIMEDTGELVPIVELNRRVKEELEKEELEKKKLAEKNREKRLAKKKRLAEKKRLTEEKQK
ncbi:hypothetical protein C1645_736416 [Glomus cerebriforme]|uniref:Uncharacterized protein n=1 Tax=Glomus cerebriforme TaxID=658196 RepID=A0A397T804_9GLOM|nr:hypothetical protein C1645_736416 [Glomus cerebriforme]